jgi:hypothetical protein
MSGQLKIVTSSVHRAEQPFLVRVEISGARPGGNPRVRLSQRDGVQPFYLRAAAADIDANGEGIAVFDDVVLHGAGKAAVLIAEPDEPGGLLRSDELRIEVVP